MSPELRKRGGAVLSALWILGCEAEAPRIAATATFGVLYGGQIQERADIPFELDGTRQTQAVRVSLKAPSPTPLTVHWELSKPGGRGKKPSTAFDEATLRVGETQWERAFPFVPGDPLGMWNVRVTLRGENKPLGDATEMLLLDRPFQVFDAAERKQRLGEIADAGK